MRRREGEQLEEHRMRSAAASGGRSGQPVHAAVLREIAGHGGGAVLDFGAGVGELTRRLLQMRRFEVTGTDILGRPPGLPTSAGWLRQDLNEPLALKDGSFDLVVAVEVIEHLENPRAVAREWFRILRPAGELIVSTPNNESWRALLALLCRGHFVAFLDSCYPAHITALVREDLQRILAEAGFADITFRFTDLRQWSGEIRRFWALND
jgi:2-polyprenyl-3-methyl-5-hydroxy-6-metoxy-1,4-benzoquinol methylase